MEHKVSFYGKLISTDATRVHTTVPLRRDGSATITKRSDGIFELEDGTEFDPRDAIEVLGGVMIPPRRKG